MLTLQNFDDYTTVHYLLPNKYMNEKLKKIRNTSSKIHVQDD